MFTPTTFALLSRPPHKLDISKNIVCVCILCHHHSLPRMDDMLFDTITTGSGINTAWLPRRDLQNLIWCFWHVFIGISEDFGSFDSYILSLYIHESGQILCTKLNSPDQVHFRRLCTHFVFCKSHWRPFKLKIISCHDRSC